MHSPQGWKCGNIFRCIPVSEKAQEDDRNDRERNSARHDQSLQQVHAHTAPAVGRACAWVLVQVVRNKYQYVQLPLIAERQKSEKRNQRADASAKIFEHFPVVRGSVATQRWRNRTKHTSMCRSSTFYPSLRSQLTIQEMCVQASPHDQKRAGAHQFTERS